MGALELAGIQTEIIESDWSYNTIRISYTEEVSK